MYQELLENLGLSPNEAKIYEALVERGESSISEISVVAKIHRRNAYDAMERLINKGLCFQVFTATENRYNATDPDRLTDFIKEKRQRLEEALPDLRDKFRRRFAPEEAYIRRGFEALRSMWRDMLRVGKDVYILGAKAQWFDARLEASRAAFFKEANRKNIKFTILFDNEIATQKPEFPGQFPGILTHKFLPKEHSTDSVMTIFGDYFVTYSGIKLGKFDENCVLFIIHSKNLAESYRKWFWYMWELSSDSINIKLKK